MGTLKEKISTNMVRKLIKIAGDHGVKKDIIDNFLVSKRKVNIEQKNLEGIEI